VLISFFSKSRYHLMSIITQDLTSEEIKQIVEMVNEKKHKEELSK
jgi:hypothetical protein